MKLWDKFCYGMGVITIVLSLAFLAYGVVTDRRDVVGYQHK